MNKAMFPAFKFLSLDYAYENIVRQKLAISWMLIPFPTGILQDEDYCHSKIFVNDIYRRPWKRSVPTCKVDEEDSVTDVWKKYASFPDPVEKQPMLCSTSHRKEDPYDIVPSSNPCSQIDLESSLTETCVTGNLHTSHEDCWKTIPSTYIEDYFLPEETVFVDYIAQFRQHLPSLATLLSRLKTFSVQDPLTDLNRVLSAKEELFRMDISIEENLEPNILLEEFHPLPPRAEESLTLPCILELVERDREYRSSVSELITILQCAPEEMSDLEGQTNTADLSAKIPHKNNFIEQYIIKGSLDPCKYEDVLDTVSFPSYHEAELEVPLTPPCSVPKNTVDRKCVNLTEEEMSPASPSFHITDASKDILECPEFHADNKPLLLKVPLIQNTSHRLTVDELKEKISINPDTSVDLTLKDNWWSKLGLNVKYNKSIEQLTANIPTTNNLAPTQMESINTITASQLERILEEKLSSMKQKTSFQKCEKQSIAHDSSLSKTTLSWPHIQRDSNVTFANTFHTADTTHLVTNENGRDQSDVLPTLPKDEKLKENLPSTTTVLSVGHVNPANTNAKHSSKAHKSLDGGLSGHEKQAKDDVDLLSSFIVLRTKRSLGENENKEAEKLPVQANTAQNSRAEHKENNVVSCHVISATSLQERSENYSKHHVITVHITPSDSQCQAYRVLHAKAVPILNKLVGLGVSACMEWNFASVSFDLTRFLLRQQEKTISDSGKTGKKSEKDTMIFKNAALLHILVTLRDLILMCTLDTAIEYLCKAKHVYKSALGPCLDDVWRKLRIIQFVRDKTEEVNPKITALLKWMKKENIKHEQLKVVVLTQMDSDGLKEALNNALSKTKGLRAIGLCPASGNTCLEPKDVLDSLRSYSFIIINNQYIQNDFPWTHFSLVIEYDCTDCWLKLCQDLNVPHMTLKTCLPDPLLRETPRNCEKDLLLDMQVPHVFLSSEELVHSSEILQVLESRYNMTFIERDCNASLQLFGKNSHCAIITVDVSTVIILQSLEELMCDKSAEYLILKLVALSLQYSSCWVLLYAKQRSHSEYNLSGDILHNVTLLYAATVQFTSKSEDLEIKILISPGVDETGSLIHRIVDYMLMFCTSDPYKWLDKSWLCVLILEAEKVLLSFPCINPMVAQLMLYRGSSLEWLLSASNDQLKELLPEVPLKVLKHFTDITALHQLSKSASSPRLSDSPAPTSMGHCCSIDNDQGSSFSIPNPCVNNKILHHNGSTQPCNDILLTRTKTNVCNDLFPFQQSGNFQPEAYEFQIHGKKNSTENKKICQPQLSSTSHTLESYNKATVPGSSVSFGEICRTEPTFWGSSRNQNKTAWSENVFEQHMQKPIYLKDCLVDSPYSSGEDSFLQSVFHQPHHVYHSSEHKPSFSINREHFFEDLLSQQNLTNPPYCKTELEDAICVSQPPPTEKQRDPLRQQTFYNHLFSATRNEQLDDLNFSQTGLVGKRRFTVNTFMTKEGTSSEKTFSQMPQLKRRKLTYERVPGRCDGQTRLKFF